MVRGTDCSMNDHREDENNYFTYSQCLNQCLNFPTNAIPESICSRFSQTKATMKEVCSFYIASVKLYLTNSGEVCSGLVQDWTLQ